MVIRKEFSLTEIVIVLLIVGAQAIIAVPCYFNYIEQAAAQVAQNNLISIYGAEKYYYSKYGIFCANHVSTPKPSPICESLSDFNANLSLNLNDNYFSYTSMLIPRGAEIDAINNSDPAFSLKLKTNAAIKPSSGPMGNPSCIYPAHQNYCP